MWKSSKCEKITLKLQKCFLYSVSMMILTLNEVKSIGNIQPDQVKVHVLKDFYLLSMLMFMLPQWNLNLN